MSDTLRTRIAKVLHTRYGRDLGYADHDWDEIDQAAYLADADVVIAELGLPPTWGKPSFENGTTDD